MKHEHAIVITKDPDDILFVLNDPAVIIHANKRFDHCDGEEVELTIKCHQDSIGYVVAFAILPEKPYYLKVFSIGKQPRWEPITQQSRIFYLEQRYIVYNGSYYTKVSAKGDSSKVVSEEDKYFSLKAEPDSVLAKYLSSFQEVEIQERIEFTKRPVCVDKENLKESMELIEELVKQEQGGIYTNLELKKEAEKHKFELYHFVIQENGNRHSFSCFYDPKSPICFIDTRWPTYNLFGLIGPYSNVVRIDASEDLYVPCCISDPKFSSEDIKLPTVDFNYSPHELVYLGKLYLYEGAPYEIKKDDPFPLTSLRVI